MFNKKEWMKEYYQKNRERLLKRSKEYHQEHKVERSKAIRRYWQKLKKEVLAHYSNDSIPSCVVCNENRLPCLTIDHINNDGASQRRALNQVAGSNFYHWLRRNNYPKGYQTLCMNCQFMKEHTRREEIV